MNRIIKITANIGMSVLLALTFVACSETAEKGEYDNWESRNQHYIDSIANVCDTNADGKWTKYVAFNLNDSIEAMHPNRNHYVYIHKEETGAGTYNPLYKDSIRVHYLGRLIPTSNHPQGYVFGKSYSSYVPNENTDVPAIMAVSQNIVGFATAAMHMVEGDRFKIYIPYYLGYGTEDNSKSSIPGYSALIFDVKLAKIYKYQIDTNTGWH